MLVKQHKIENNLNILLPEKEIILEVYSSYSISGSLAILGSDHRDPEEGQLNNTTEIK